MGLLKGETRLPFSKPTETQEVRKMKIRALLVGLLLVLSLGAFYLREWRRAASIGEDFHSFVPEAVDEFRAWAEGEGLRVPPRG